MYILDKQNATHPDLNLLYNEAIDLLATLISIPSFSGAEERTADEIELHLAKHQIKTIRKQNNVWCYNKFFDQQKPTILLNSHHDTVKPNEQYTRDPFAAVVYDDKLYGLGSNDAGGALVSLISTFVYFYASEDLPFNLCLAATAEEETSVGSGIKCILD